MNKTEYTAFMNMLKRNGRSLSRQEFLTIRGQAMAGDLEGARRGLKKLLLRRCG